jgi:glycosyltransferase involved in cell wall biosynthesis
MYDGHAVGVVVPAYNEEGLIGGVLETVPAFVDRVYVVDDCSVDGTWDEIVSRVDGGPAEPVPAAAGARVDGSEQVAPDVSLSDGGRVEGETIVPLRHETNRGRGAAVKTGYRRALHEDIDVVAVMDGDGQMDPDYLADVVDPVASGAAGYAKGDRLSVDAHRANMPGWRLFGNVLLTVLTKIASGYWGMRDPQNGYTAISADVLERIDFEDLYEDYGFLNDLLIRLGCHDVTVRDVPMPAVYGDESSGIRYSTFVPKLSLLLLRGFLARLWTKSVWLVTRNRQAAGWLPLAGALDTRPALSVSSQGVAIWPVLLGAMLIALTLLVVGAPDHAEPGGTDQQPEADGTQRDGA